MDFLIAALSALVGIIIGAVMMAKVGDKCDQDAEKSGVWVNDDRAYKLTRIEPQ